MMTCPDATTNPTDLTLLTANAAAAILGVDVKTFKKMAVPYILAGRSRRYTRQGLQMWLERSLVDPYGEQFTAGTSVKSRGSNTSRAAPTARSGISASKSEVVEFAKLLALTT